MTNKQILCIVEGEVSEVEILKKLNEEFIRKKIEFVPLCTNIYHIYHAYLKEQEEIGSSINMFLFLKIKYDKNGVLKDKKERDFLGIYLFLDFDGHEPLAQNYTACIPKMLRLFDNHKENGKLYISYPMVESFYHPIYGCDICEVFKIASGKKYKKYIHKITYNKFELIDDLHKETLNQNLIAHLKQANLLVHNNFEFPSNYNIDEWAQLSIYENQLNKYILNNNSVFVFSSFVLFLLEYLGENLFLEWKNLNQ